MVPTLRSALLGSNQTGVRRHLGFGLVVFIVTFVAYALGVFYVSGGVVFIPYYAAIVGMIAAVGLGYRRDSLVFGWTLAYMSLLGFHADHAFLGIAHRSLLYRLLYFVRPDSLVFLAVGGIVLGTLGCVVGTLLRWGIECVRSGSLVATKN